MFSKLKDLCLDMIFTDLAQLLGKLCGNRYFQHPGRALPGCIWWRWYFVWLSLPYEASARYLEYSYQALKVSEIFDHYFLGAATTPRLEVMAMARDAGLVSLLLYPMSTERLPFLEVLLARNAARKQGLSPHPRGCPTTASQPAQTILFFILF